MKKQGFTLIELLAVVIILGVIMIIAVPTIKGVIKNSTREAFIIDAKNVLKALDYYMLDDEDASLLEDLNVSSLKSMLNISNSNYSSIEVSFDRYLNPFIKLTGKDKWKGLMACGTSNDLEIGSNIDCDVPPFPATLSDGQLCGSVFYDSRDGNKYQTVQIGSQCWFAENLRYTGNGCLKKDFWDEYIDETDGGCMVVSSGEEYEYWDEEDDDLKYAVVPMWLIGEVHYQWGAVMNGVLDPEDDSVQQGLCPKGWHIPSDEEWLQMEEYICDKSGGTDCVGLANKLKSTIDWDGEGTDDYGFKARPVGYRDSSGPLNDVGWYGFWWSSSPYDDGAWERGVYLGDSGILRDWYYLENGGSARCVWDLNPASP